MKKIYLKDTIARARTYASSILKAVNNPLRASLDSNNYENGSFKEELKLELLLDIKKAGSAILYQDAEFLSKLLECSEDPMYAARYTLFIYMRDTVSTFMKSRIEHCVLKEPTKEVLQLLNEHTLTHLVGIKESSEELANMKRVKWADS